MRLSRRAFLATSMCGLLGLRALSRPPIPGRICGANHSLAHRRATQRFPRPSRQLSTDVLIVGGGVAGLSAARRLRSAGVERIALVELEGTTGGNSLAGRNQISAYPWGAHYLPLPNNSNDALLEFLRESDVVSLGSKPRYQDEYLCATPQERLWIYGKWQDGLVPQRGVDGAARAEIERFHRLVEDYRAKIGSDGRYFFDIPVRRSSRDPEAILLDRITMKSWMRDQGFVSPELDWYVNYCCRDDYGTSFAEVSAWAGLHYFASRRADPEQADPDNVLTWSEGNYFLVERLSSAARADTFANSLVYHLETTRHGVRAHCFDGNTQTSFTCDARACVLAVPSFVRAPLSGGSPTSSSYAPWIVANVTLLSPPKGAGRPLSWDNVVYNSKLLGYVHARHQSLSQSIQDTVITYYYPMSEYPPDLARMIAYQASLSELQGEFVSELERIHPELDGKIANVDIWIWGHAMIRPTPGTIWPDNSREERLPAGVFAAHSDQSGISIFEEAFYQGLVAGEGVMKHLDIRGASWV